MSFSSKVKEQAAEAKKIIEQRAKSTTATWGSKKWEVNEHRIFALQDLSFSFAKADDSGDTKKASVNGREPFVLSCSTVLHSGVGIDVFKEIQSWNKLVGKKHDFLLGKEVLYKNLELTKVDVGSVKTDDLGRMRLATLTFEFKEETPTKATSSSTTKTATATTAAGVKPSATEKANKVGASGIAKVSKHALGGVGASLKKIKVGSRVKVTGKKYVTGETIPDYVKTATHKVSQIKGNAVLLGYPNGIRSWVYTADVTLV